MQSKERVLTALNHEEPDRVPIFELSIESTNVIKGYGGNKIVTLFDVDIEVCVNMMKKIGTDLFAIPVVGLPIGKSARLGVRLPKGLMSRKIPSHKNMLDEFGALHTFKQLGDNEPETFQYIGGYFFSSTGDLEEVMAKYDKWTLPDVDHPLRFRPLERGIETSGTEGPYIIPGLQGYFEHSWQPFGFETYSKLLFEHPDFITRVLDDCEMFLNGVIEKLIDRGCELLMYWDDHGFKTGPIISPRLFKQLIYPRIKNLIRKCHDGGMKVIHHSCGNVNKLIPLMLDAGIDALNPLEPSASMDIFQVHQDHG
ncbi:MAG: uroporphyrinogen decarboxylase family protein, partial [Candidatus Helarchaeota archaeon]